jgi:hypothetical protein
VITTNGGISGSDSLLVTAKFLEKVMFNIQQEIISLGENKT